MRGCPESRRRSARLSIAALSISICLLMLGAATASAGYYDVKNCTYSGSVFFDGTYEQLSADRVDVVDGCRRLDDPKIGIYQDRSGLSLASGAGGRFNWTSPPGAAIHGTEIVGKLRNANGIAAEIYASNADLGYEDLDHGFAHDGALSTMGSWFPATPRRTVTARLSCRSNPPCENGSSGSKAFIELQSVKLTLYDNSLPQVSVSGDVSGIDAAPVWRSGVLSISINASDSGSGVSGFVSEINGVTRPLSSISCPGDRGAFADRVRPCPEQAQNQVTLDTRSSMFNAGKNRIRICARDYATNYPSNAPGSNLGCSASYAIWVDNSGPASPVDLRSVQGSDWRPLSRYDLRWQNSATDGMSAVTRAIYRIETGSGLPIQGPTSVWGTSLTSMGIDLPEPGEYKVHVSLADSAGNTSPEGSLVLRYDNISPGEAAPAPAGGWLGLDEFPYTQQIERGLTAGPSGIRGYAYGIGSSESPVCVAAICTDGELDLRGGPDKRSVPIDNLPEGVQWFTSAAVSGSMLPSVRTRSTRLMVDKGDPSTVISGVPSDWVNDPVELSVQASDEMSGMTANPDYDDGSPFTAISVDGAEVAKVAGARATTSVRSEGVHRVTHWARDLAGNSGDGHLSPLDNRHTAPGVATVKIDLTPPRVVFEDTRSSDQPELIRARFSDPLSGLDEAEIEYHLVDGSTPWMRMPTAVEGDQLSAVFPSDRLDDGNYEFRATAADKAGNRSINVQREGGGEMTLNNPVKVGTRLHARLLGGNQYHQIRRSGAGAIAVGKLMTTIGTPVAGEEVTLMETFDRGARVAQRTLTIRTDAQGAFRVKLRAGPSRLISAEYPGDDRRTHAQSGLLRISATTSVALAITPTVTRNGRAVNMTGKVTGRQARVPARGKMIEIQYFDPSRKLWRPVEILHTSGSGRFHYSYRFRTISSAQQIIFRALAPAESGWPFLPAASRRQTVVVYP